MIHNQPRVSIILPTYNGEKYLEASIRSCLSQTYRNIELIVIDDCSKDSTPNIIQSFSDPRIKYIRNAINQRLPRSLNIGFKHATGDYLTWTSDDNEFIPHAIEELVEFLTNHPKVDFVYTDMIIRNLESGENRLERFSDINLEKENNIGACYLYTRRLYQAVGDYDPRFEWVEDYDYWIRVAKKFQVRHLPKALYIYGDHAQSLTSTRKYPIVMMRDILRHWHGYLSISEFMEAIRQFSADVHNNITGREAQINAWKQVFKKSFGISAVFGIKFLSLFLLLLLRKTFNALLKPLTGPLREHHKEDRFNHITSSLKGSSSRKNVLVMIPDLVVGGSERVGWDLIKGLEPEGFDFHLITNKKETNAWCQKFCAAHKNVILLEEGAADEDYNRYLPEVIRKLNIDLLLNNNATVGYRCLPPLKSQFPNLKTMDMIHLEHVGGAIEKYAWAAKYLDRRICISRQLKDHMIQMYRSNSIANEYDRRIDVVYNGITEPSSEKKDLLKGGFRKSHNIPSDTKIISFVGRMAPEKKPFLFIDIARTLMAQLPQERFKFVMAGSGPFLAKVRNRIKECGLQDHFILTGMLPDVSELLADTFLLLVVSQHEGIPLVIQEAYTMNVPVISTRVGAIHELIQEGINGHLINFDDTVIDQFVEKITALTLSPATHQQMSSRVRATMEPEFLFDHMVRRYHGIFDELIGKGKT